MSFSCCISMVVELEALVVRVFNISLALVKMTSAFFLGSVPAVEDGFAARILAHQASASTNTDFLNSANDFSVSTLFFMASSSLSLARLTMLVALVEYCLASLACPLRTLLGFVGLGFDGASAEEEAQATWPAGGSSSSPSSSSSSLSSSSPPDAAFDACSNTILARAIAACGKSLTVFSGVKSVRMEKEAQGMLTEVVPNSPPVHAAGTRTCSCLISVCSSSSSPLSAFASSSETGADSNLMRWCGSTTKHSPSAGLSLVWGAVCMNTTALTFLK